MERTDLTPQQSAVVEHEGSALLVSAAAGSGKTKVLVERLLRRICDPIQPANVDEFLVITFTRAAAAELRNKILSEIEERISSDPSNTHLLRQRTRIYTAQISTVHSFCAGILKDYACRLDIPADFRVGDDLSCEPLRRKALEDTLEELHGSLGKDPQAAALVDGLGFGRDDRRLSKLIENLHRESQSSSDPKKWLLECKKHALSEQTDDVGKTIWGAYLLKDAKRGISALSERLIFARSLAEGLTGADKLCAVLDSDLAQLRGYAEMERWDEFFSAGQPNFQRFPTIKAPEDAAVKKQIKDIRDAVKERLKKLLSRFGSSSGDAMSDLRKSGEALCGLVDSVLKFEENYQKGKRRQHILDFNDLEHRTFHLLMDSEGNPNDCAAEISARYLEVMVDEYQDSNSVQDAIYRAVSGHGEKLFMVGDVKQSIYRFRLADPTIFLKKYEAFSFLEKGEPGIPRKIVLSNNFRSAPPILDAVNHVFRTVMSGEVGDVVYGEQEALSTIRTFPPLGEPAVELYLVDSQSNEEEDPERKEIIEARFVADRILELTDGSHMAYSKDGALRPIGFGDILILMRSGNAQAPLYAQILGNRGIPCRTNRSAGIFQTTEYDTLVSWLKTIENPHRDVPLLAAMTSPLCCFSAEELTQIRLLDRDSDFFDALTLCSSENAVAFRELLGEFRACAAYLSLSELYRLLCERLSVCEIFGAMENGETRCRNIRTLGEMIVDLENGGCGDLSALVGRLELLEASEITISPTQPEVADCVTIMTSHQSKGLEAPVVFISDLSRGFNMEDLREGVISDPELYLGCDTYDSELQYRYPGVAKQAIQQKRMKERVSEELRLLYVAMTRATSRLIMTYCSARIDDKLAAINNNAAYPLDPFCSGSVACPGDWVLYGAAMLQESGNLFAPLRDRCPPGDHPWKIRRFSAGEQESSVVRDEVQEKIAPGLNTVCLGLEYDHERASLPAKLTATQMKGRGLDLESAENAEPEQIAAAPKILSRSFSGEEKPLSAKEKGVALHCFLQYCRYEECSEIAGVEREKRRLAEQEFLSSRQLEAVEPQTIVTFFRSELGRRILHSETVQREFKFSVLIPSERIYPEHPGEQIMLQGVVDCFLEEPDGICVIDYKSDRAAPGREDCLADRYRGQIRAYAEALAEIFGKPVKEAYLVCLQTGASVAV